MISSSVLNPISLQFLYNISLANANCKVITNLINAVLLLNILQHLVLKGVLDHVIQNKGRLCITRKDQFLLYIRGEKGVEKSHVIYALEIGFTLLDKKNELMLSTSMKNIAEDIRKSMMHIILNISTCNLKILSINVSGI